MSGLFVCTLDVGHTGSHSYLFEPLVSWLKCRAVSPTLADESDPEATLAASGLTYDYLEHFHRCPDCQTEWGHSLANCELVGSARAICPACEDNYLDNREDES